MTLSNLESFANIGFVATDPRLPDNPVVDCNDSFLELTGYERHEVIGRNCRFLAGPGTDPEKLKLVSEAVEEERPVMVELLNYRKDGTPFLNAVMVAPIYDDEGDLVGYLGSHLATSRNGLKQPTTFNNRINGALSNGIDGPLNDRIDSAKKAVDELSPRQTQVLKGLLAGKRIKQVAFELELSERTVKLHRAAMLKSLGAATNAEAIRLAVEAGL